MHESSYRTYRIRSYVTSDRAACLTLFDSNTPKFFAISERQEFADFLDGPSATMLVLENSASEIIACGGYWLRDDAGEGGLAWGMVMRSWHGQGVGRVLLKERLVALAAVGARVVTVRTSQHSRGFFEREGFEYVRMVPDGFAPGIDLVELRIRLLFRNH